MDQRQLFLRHVAQTSQAPMLVEVARAEGCYLYAPDGKRYLDLISGIGVSNVGHCAPEVVAAVQAQAARAFRARCCPFQSRLRFTHDHGGAADLGGGLS